MRPQKLDDEAISTWLGTHAGWSRHGETLTRQFTFPDYPAGIAFVVRVGFAAEKKDHHPDLTVGYRKVGVSWSTHDAKGVTAFDLELAEACDRIAAGGA